jgi:hypothetical protein
MHALIAVCILALAQPGPARAAAPDPSGGRLRLGSESLAFSPRSLELAARSPGEAGGRVFRLKGRLLGGAVPAELELTGFESGKLYMMKLQRRGPQGTDTWASTLQTRMEVLAFDGRPGGRLHLRLSGPLLGSVAGRAVHTTWQGEIWAVFAETP